jgi:hypothetical protein
LNKATKIKARRFLREYAECGGITESARRAKISPRAHYVWLRDHADYREEFEQAGKLLDEKLEVELIDSVLNGVPDQVLYQGEVIHVDGEPLIHRRRSDILLMFALKARMPEKYRDTWKGEIEHKGEIRPDPDLARLNLEQLKTLRAIAQQAISTTNGHSKHPEELPGFDGA